MLDLPIPRQRYSQSMLPVILGYGWLAALFTLAYYIVEVL